MIERPKTAVEQFLRDRDWEGLIGWAEKNRGGVRFLLSHLHSNDSLLQERAVEGLGLIAAQIFKGNPEKVRELIRRLLWSMNDESGNLIQRAPEAIGEILANVPDLIGEYADILFSFWDESPFERGVHWAAARLSSVKPSTLTKYLGRLKRDLESSDIAIRLHSATALKNLGLSPSVT
jgi:hypothetical protein